MNAKASPKHRPRCRAESPAESPAESALHRWEGFGWLSGQASLVAFPTHQVTLRDPCVTPFRMACLTSPPNCPCSG